MKPAENGLVLIVRVALGVGRRCMAPYAHPKSPRTFTQPQLLACLVLKANLKLTYRGVVDVLAVSPVLREAMGLATIPHYTTLQKFAASKGTLAVLDAALAELVLGMNGGEVLATRDVAIDATGMESSCASAHFVSRAGKKRSRWIRVSAVVICTGVLPAAMHVDWGPGNDAAPALGLLHKAAGVVRPGRVWGDAAYDSEALHAYCHERWGGVGGVVSYAPPIQRRGSGVVRGRYRAAMGERPDDYGRRWTVESLFSAIKRVCGSVLSARREQTLKAEAALRVLAYAIRR